MKIKYQGEVNREPETYTGNAQEWPDGLFVCDLYTIFVDEGDVSIWYDGRPTAYNNDYPWITPFTRLTDYAQIACVTMVGAPLQAEPLPPLGDNDSWVGPDPLPLPDRDRGGVERIEQ